MSAYAALGLEPGADRAAIEEAYRRLIKRYHPDRSGGDAERAAEINRAYFELRQPPERTEHRPDAGDDAGGVGRRGASGRGRGQPGTRRRRPSRLWPVLAAATGALLIVGGTRLGGMADQLDDLRPLAGSGSARRADSRALDSPLRQTVIAKAMTQAQGLAERGDQARLAQLSRSCHRKMRLQPELAQLDRCAAFDNTVAALADPDPIHDRGPFSASAVTSRLMTAASLLSSDYLAIERRLDRIRMTVELGLKPPPPPPPPPVVEKDEMEVEPVEPGNRG